MSFLKKLFGLGQSEASGAASVPVAEEMHEGFQIAATPIKEGAQYRLAGTISKDIDGEMQVHKLIRADLFSSADECAKFTMIKAKQVIKEQGDRLFG